MYSRIKGESVIIYTVDHMDFSGVVGDSLDSSRGKCIVLEGPSVESLNQKFVIVPLQEIKYVVGLKKGREPIAVEE